MSFGSRNCKLVARVKPEIPTHWWFNILTQGFARRSRCIGNTLVKNSIAKIRPYRYEISFTCAIQITINAFGLLLGGQVLLPMLIFSALNEAQTCRSFLGT